MRPLHHRDPGAIGALMEDRRVSVELIADGIHVHPAVLRLVRNEGGNHQIVLITDAMGAAGAPTVATCWASSGRRRRRSRAAR